MNALEKILEEIENMRDIMQSTVATDCFGKECKYMDCTVCVCERVIEIIRSHMDDGKDTNVPSTDDWIPVEERLPKDDRYILLSFENFSLPLIGRYEENEKGGAFYIGDCDEEDTCVSNDLFVNAWQPLPESYKGEEAAG